MNISEHIAKLRAGAKMTQEEFAEALCVTRQAVQKWESGTGIPDLENLIKIARKFGVTLDQLVMSTERRVLEVLHQEQKLEPDYDQIASWETYAGNIKIEYQQSYDEGKDIKNYESLFEAVSKMPPDHLKSRIADVLFDLIMSAPQREGYPYDEPSDLEMIRVLKRGGTPKKPLPEKSVLCDQVRGAWLGRICGCLLGKPVEGWKTEQLHPLLKKSGNWPMHRYILSTDVEENEKGKCWADTIECMPSDDDTNYTVLAQVIVEKYGREFSAGQVARAWLDYQPKYAYCSAENVAFCNFVKGYLPPKSALYQNPYREWIGAQIRGDYYGYINPGNPEKAAETAFRDASISHVKNGIYGEMFVAAVLAQAAVEKDMEKVIQAGLSEIPTTSRLFEALSRVIADWRNGVGAEECFARIHKQWDERESHPWCHTISNAMIVVASLLYGGGDFGKSICMAVQTGFDTDCNGATVGSILGMLYGTRIIGEEWFKPINSELDTSIFGVGRVKIDDLAAKTLEHMPEGTY